jgi:hypothetical protein
MNVTFCSEEDLEHLVHIRWPCFLLHSLADTTGTVPREVGIVSKHTPPPKQTLELTQTVAAATTSAKKCYSYEHTE